jgi:hypothetical protein
VPPGSSITVKITADPTDVLSMAMMLVQTNDGFAGVADLPLQMMMAELEVPAYDAGTEENTESASDVPGPPFGGMGHPATIPAQPIGVHPDITGKADLPAAYDWTGAVARITTRLAS